LFDEIEQKGEVVTFKEAVNKSELAAEMAADEIKKGGDTQKAQVYAMLAQYYLDSARLNFELQKSGAL